MSKKDDDLLTPSTKKIRFRGDLNSHYFEHHIEDIFDDDRKKTKPIADEHPDKGKIKLVFVLRVMSLSLFCVRINAMCHSGLL